jgi:lipopolysaccharide transport system permease protein
MAHDAAALPLRVIEPRPGWVPLDWRALWEGRELLAFLIWRDVKVRYKQAALGAAWAILQPLATMAVFAVLFGRWAKVPSDGVPYPAFALAALLPWTFFANAVSAAATSLVGNTHLISKVYFPRLLISLAAVGCGLVDLAVALTAMGALLAFYGIAPGWQIVAVPPLTLLVVLVSVGVGSALAALCAIYRDVRFVIPFALQLLMFASPVIYPVSLIPPEHRWLFYLNPLVGAIDGFRAALLGLPFSWTPLAWSAAVSAACLWGGLSYFARTERRVADLI